ncbi:hypothetical protein NB724_003971 [Pantoea ananatis]|jgi:hypothetical protein|uniref:Secreted protein n=1 Tax=Pantoea ananas TaxID=553 RepID=A0AAJ1D206_PANAN|nr:hypothetical protein [Pantoea ananatis]MCW0310270.1 hypothetical protein [Pantoea ananatis]MCW0318820.1 hypothetical protein [Pantoea ananatis]MCW0332706.1 hypothetical protein [Pantoea ananatis]MCW0336988.1 hypothetical protein [Pantoea ananatis]
MLVVIKMFSFFSALVLLLACTRASAEIHAAAGGNVVPGERKSNHLLKGGWNRRIFLLSSPPQRRHPMSASVWLNLPEKRSVSPAHQYTANSHFHSCKPDTKPHVCIHVHHASSAEFISAPTPEKSLRPELNKHTDLLNQTGGRLQYVIVQHESCSSALHRRACFRYLKISAKKLRNTVVPYLRRA